jgi:ferric-chelate reductase [NAD(P)H]
MVQDALLKIVYGMYVITSRAGEKMNGMIATTACQVTAEPVRMSVTVSKENFSHQLIEKTGVFGVNVLGRDTDFSFIGRFGFKSGRDFNKFENIAYSMGRTGVPLISDNAIAVAESRVISSLDAGSHTIFLAEVVDARILNNEPALTYEYYHTVIKGKSPKNAPTYIPDLRKII